MLILSICGTLVLKTVSCCVSTEPAAAKLVSAAPVTSGPWTEFVELVVNLTVFVPVSNLGFASVFGSGMLKQAVNVPIASVTNLTSVTVASAPLDCPINFIFFLTCPKKEPWTWVARLKVSTFKKVVDVE